MPAGNVADIAFGIQSAKGVPLVPSGSNAYRCLVAGGWIAPQREEADLEETGTTRLRSQSFVRMTRAGGSPVFFVRPEMIGGLLYGAMGAKSTTGAGDPWTHTFVLNATQPFMTFWTAQNAVKFEQFVDCKIASLRIESTAGNPIRATVEVTGVSPTFESPNPAAALVAEIVPAFMHYDGKGALKVEGAAVASIDSWILTIATGVVAAQGDSVNPDSVNEGMFDITLETSQIIQDFALFNRLHYGSATPADGAAPNPSTIELAGAPAGIDFLFTRQASAPVRSLEILAPRLQIRTLAGYDPNQNGDPLRQTVTYRVMQPASGSGLTAILKNSRAIP